jgi:flagellar hook-associated protein FlgK
MANAIMEAVNGVYDTATASGSRTPFFQSGTGSSLIVLNPVISATSLVTGPSGNAGDNAYVKSIGNLRTTVSTVSIAKDGSLLLNSDSVVKMGDVTGLTAGMKVSGPTGIAVGTTIKFVNASTVPPTITLSSAFTGTSTSAPSGDTLTFEVNSKLLDYARGMVTDIAVSAQAASSRLEEATVLETALRTQRDSVSAVSLDEETTDLLRFQKAYQANAKVISVIDEMLQSLIAMVR